MESEGSQPQTAVEHVLQHSTHKRNTGYVLIKLAWCIDQGNNCPSHNELASLTGLTKPTVQHALGELEKDGTITITRHGGGIKRGGKKNCYALPGMTADPVKKPGQMVLPGKNDPVKPVVPGKETPGKTDLPGKNPEDAPVPAHDAAGENALSKNSPVLSEKDLTGQLADTISNPPEDFEFEDTSPTLPFDNFEAEPITQVIPTSLYQPVEGESFASLPGSAPSLSPEPEDVAKDYWHSHLGMLTGTYLVRLNAAVKKYGLAAVKEAIDAAKVMGSEIQYVMSWVEARLEGQVLEGKSGGQKPPPKPRPNNYRARSHRQTDDSPPPPKDYPDDMQFEPPPPKASRAIGVPA